MALNVLLKAFQGPFSKVMMEEAFRGRAIDTCISMNDLKTDFSFPNRHIWMSAKSLRECRYPGVDWKNIIPLDEELIEAMSLCETMFLSMIERYARHEDIPYAERRRQYLDHLRYWNHTLDKEKIGLFLLFNSPHQCYDYVIYQLCKLKGIPTFNLEHCFSLPAFFVTDDFERSAYELGEAYSRLKIEYADAHKPIPLLPKYETFLSAATTQGAPLRRATPDRYLTKKNFIAKWQGRALSMMIRKPRQFAASVLSPNVWMRKLSQHRAAIFYDQHIQQPDFSLPYVYVPLHLQPEDAVTPRGGGFRDQELVVQLLASTLPTGMNIYVKEHPAQSELCRSERFYRTICSIPSVTFIPRNCNTFQLIQHAKAVATVTGTAGFEALFFGKPVLMFGHRFYQYAPGVYRIRNMEDCRNAVDSIFIQGEKPDQRDMRLFLRAVQDCGVFYFEKPSLSAELAERESQARAMGRKIWETTNSLFVSS